jgi:type IV secretory pathway VirB2 component (pilin)
MPNETCSALDEGSRLEQESHVRPDATKCGGADNAGKSILVTEEEEHIGPVYASVRLERRLTVIEAGTSLSQRVDVAIVMTRMIFFGVLGIATATSGYAQTDPWSNAATKMGSVFSGPIVKGFSLVAIVLGGLELAFGEGGSKRLIGGLIFGLGMALGAASFMSWLFS